MNDLLIRAGEFEVQTRSAEERTITGIITTNAIDRYREIVEPKGAVLENYRKNPVVLLNHNSWGIPIGRNRWIKPQESGLVAQTQFADTAEGHDLFKLYDQGYMKAWSIGFIPKKWDDADGSEGYRRKYTVWELLEYSAVTIPANPEAVTNMLGVLESDRLREYVQRSTSEINTETRISEILLTLKDVSERMHVMGETIIELQTKLQVRDALLTNIEEEDNAAAGDTSHGQQEQKATAREPMPVKPQPETPKAILSISPDEIAKTVAEVLGKKLSQYNLIK